MNFFVIAKFFKDQAEGNEELRLVMEKLDKKIKEYNKLRSENLALEDEEFNLQMKNQMLQSISDHTKELCEEHKKCNQAISVLNKAFQEFPLRKIDMDAVVKNHISLLEMKWENEKRELDEEHQQRKEMLKRLENRNIVQKLRRTQKEYQDALKKKQEAEAFKKTHLKEIQQKLKDAEEKRNNLILSMVTEAKNLKTARLEKMYTFEQSQKLKKLEDKKNELMTKLQQRQRNQETCAASTSKTAQKLEENTNIIGDLPTFDSYLKTLNLDTETEKILQEFSIESQKKALQEETPNNLGNTTEEFPISSSKNYVKDVEGSANMEIDPNSDGACSLSAPFSPFDCIKGGISNLSTSFIQDMPTGSSMDNEKITDLLIPTNEISVTDAKFETYSDMLENNIEMSLNTMQISETNAEMFTKPQSGMEDIECKTVRAAGAALHETIPSTLSPRSEISSNDNLVAVAATRLVSQPAKDIKRLENGTETKSVLTEISRIASVSDQWLKKKNLDLIFESLLAVLSSKETLSSDGFKTVTDSNTDNFTLDFDNDVEKFK